MTLKTSNSFLNVVTVGEAKFQVDIEEEGGSSDLKVQLEKVKFDGPLVGMDILLICKFKAGFHLICAITDESPAIEATSPFTSIM